MPTDELTHEELEATLAWWTDFLEQVEAADGLWLPRGYVEIPDTRPLVVIERVLREALKRQGDGHGSDLGR